MKQSVVPVLLLAIVALSSSNILLVSSLQLPANQPAYSQTDNIFSHKFFTSNILKHMFCKELVGTSYKYPKMCKTMQAKYDGKDNKEIDVLNLLHKGEKSSGEGFRKEQWHNYPRQLDRLHRFLEDHHRSNTNPKSDPDFSLDEYLPLFKDNYVKDTSRELDVDSPLDTANEDESTDINPLLVLKIRFNSLKNDLKSKRDAYPDELSQPEYVNGQQSEDNAYETYNDNHLDLRNQQNTELEDKGMTINKRLFSLWSRLQGLAPRGHELHHRRYLHAIYGLQDGDSSALTAETRATLMRPPGSPLRWG